MAELEPKEGTFRERLVILWNYSKGFCGSYLVAMLSQAGSSTAKAVTFFLLGYLVDQTVDHNSFMDILPLLAGGIIGLALLDGLFSFLSGRFAAQSSENVARRLRNTLYDHIQHLPFTYHDRMAAGELIQRSTSDVDAVRRFFADQAIGVVRIVMLFLVNFTALLFINAKLALSSVVVVPAIVVVSVFFFRRVSKVYDDYQDQDAILSTMLQENLAGVRVVRAFARQDFEIGQVREGKYRKIPPRAHPALDAIALLAVERYPLRLAGAGRLHARGDHGDPWGDHCRRIHHLHRASCVSNLADARSRPADCACLQRTGFGVPHWRDPARTRGGSGCGLYTPVGPARGEVEFRNVSFEYRGEATILRNINFHCRPGQAVALLGPTGSGKTSLVNLLPRFYDYTAGSILLDGVELREYPKRYLRSQIGIVEQEPFLFSRTIRENIVYGVEREVPDSEVEAAAGAAALHDVILSFPEGYGRWWGKRA